MKVSNRWSGLELALAWLVQLVLIFSLGHLPGCSDGYINEGSAGTLTQSVVGCTVSSTRYPTTESDFNHLYAGRGFLADDVHIGRDVLLREGAPIYPIACGTIRIYRAASGYGTLAVVIEHHLPSAITVRNGVGVEVRVQDFLSIYGHLRPTSLIHGGTALNWHDGDTVRPDQIIGYVQNGELNGDGAEHLHLGIRLQTAADAMRTESTAWFAGYDPDHTRRRWYADPATFMNVLLHRSSLTATSTWHPPGTLLNIAGQNWLVISEGVIAPIMTATVEAERFGSRIVMGAPAEVACMTVAGFSLERTSDHHLVRFADQSTVYEYADGSSPQRYTFLAQQAFDSWGWTASQIEVRAAGERAAFLMHYRDAGVRRLREGALVKVNGRSDVYVVSQGTRRPIFDWPTFLAFGYDESWIIEVDSSVLDVLAGPQGAVIRPEDLRQCHGAGTTLAMDAGASSTPDAAVTAMDATAGVDVSIDATVDTPSMDAGIDSGPDAVVGADALSVRDVSSMMDAFTRDTATMETSGPASCSNPPLHDAGVVSADAGSTFDVASWVSDATVDASVVDLPPPAGTVPPGAVMRYEFRLASDPDNWRPTEPYFLRDRYWSPQRCLNAIGSDPTRMVAQGGGWYRCDTSDVYNIFVGTFFSPFNLSSGDRGNIATVDNWPVACSPRSGIEWRISELPSGRELYHGPSSGLSCTNVGTQSRHQLP